MEALSNSSQKQIDTNIVILNSNPNQSPLESSVNRQWGDVSPPLLPGLGFDGTVTELTTPVVSVGEKVVGMIGEYIDQPSLLLRRDPSLLRPVIDMALAYSGSEEKSAIELLQEIGYASSIEMWKYVRTTYKAQPPEKQSEIAFFPALDKCYTEFSEHKDILRLRREILKIMSMKQFEQFFGKGMVNYNEKHGTSFRSVEDMVKDNVHKRVRAIAFTIATHQDKNPISLRTSLQTIASQHLFREFASCCVEDILATPQNANTPVLQLLDQFVIDFMQSNRESIWFQSVENNFGYSRSEEAWNSFVGPDTLIRTMVDGIMGNFELIIDRFSTNNTFPYSGVIRDLSQHLEWILFTPLDILYTRLADKSIQVDRPDYYDNLYNRMFHYSFLTWAVQEVQKTHPQLVDYSLAKDFLLRARLAGLVLPTNPERLERNAANAYKIQFAEEVAKLIDEGISASEHAATNLINSRDPAGVPQDLLLGIGFQGRLFSDQPNAKHQDERIFLNVSEKGRRLPRGKEKKENILFAMPFLFATQYFLRKMKHPSGVELPITVLGQPKEEDRQVHRYLLERLFTHAFTNENVNLHQGFLSGAARNEIVQTIIKHCLDPKQAQKKFRGVEGNAARQVAERVIARLQTDERPILSEQELQLLLEVLKNRSSICVESVISRHNKNNLVVPIAFDLGREEIVKIGGEKVMIGPRGVIPPCTRYCQLFAGSHLLWADLTRNLVPQVLNQVATEEQIKG